MSCFTFARISILCLHYSEENRRSIFDSDCFLSFLSLFAAIWWDCRGFADFLRLSCYAHCAAVICVFLCCFFTRTSLVAFDFVEFSDFHNFLAQLPLPFCLFEFTHLHDIKFSFCHNEFHSRAACDTNIFVSSFCYAYLELECHSNLQRSPKSLIQLQFCSAFFLYPLFVSCSSAAIRENLSHVIVITLGFAWEYSNSFNTRDRRPSVPQETSTMMQKNENIFCIYKCRAQMFSTRQQRVDGTRGKRGWAKKAFRPKWNKTRRSRDIPLRW